MVKYYFENETFIIEDFQNAKTFSSFFPAVSGLDGLPLWVFYCNRGQCISSFGVQSKSTPIIPFDTAYSAYQNVALKSFRTFIKANKKYIEPFSNLNNTKTSMKIDRAKLTINEKEKDFNIEVTYSTVPHENYSALIRKVKITNISNKVVNFEILDGLPMILPHGFSTYEYKELATLMSSYCVIENLNNKMPFIKFNTSNNDCSEITENKTGNAFISIDINNNKLDSIIDSSLVFGNDLSLQKPLHFINSSFLELNNQQKENRMPCAFSYTTFSLNSNEEYEFATIIGKFENIEHFNTKLTNITLEKINEYIRKNDELINDLLSPMEVSSNNKLFDQYAKQSLLDNNLRGGFPIKITDSTPYYVYGRKHGDMERDYNNFQINNSYYSCGEGHFRDVNQNRRSDIYLYPFVKDFNIKLFFNLIQIDGHNPLNVKPSTFNIKEEYLSNITDEKIKKIVTSNFLPSSLYTYLKNNYSDYDSMFKKIIDWSNQNIEAAFEEGYWIDHWTYNVDLLLNYISVYPDYIEELLFNNSYKYFYSPIYIEPRSGKYCLLNDGRVRQYGSINRVKANEKCKENNTNLHQTDWLKDRNGNTIYTTLLSKIFNLILIKFSTLDSNQMGIEMECDKPGWNDAMNGLPGLFASSLGESIEILRLINFFKDNTTKFNDRNIDLLIEQYEFMKSINGYINKLRKGKITSFEYWDNVTSSREIFRDKVKDSVLGTTQSVKISYINTLLDKMQKVITKGINKAKKLHNGIIPSYIIYDVNEYELTGKTNHLGHKTVNVKSFTLTKVPLFLEATARSYKVNNKISLKKDYYKIKETNLYDKTLKIYKTCENIDDASFEIGRIHAFTKGWLERESNFVHMTYKYLLGILKKGWYKEFYKECETNMMYNLNPKVYGRSPIENSSFIVPTCNPDPSKHGQGFFARLTGANAEFLDMLNIMMFGEKLFIMNNNLLQLNLDPKLHKSFFKKDGTFTFRLLNKTKVTYYNSNHINAYERKSLKYVIDNVEYDIVNGDLAHKVRNGEIKEIHVYID